MTGTCKDEASVLQLAFGNAEVRDPATGGVGNLKALVNFYGERCKLKQTDSLLTAKRFVIYND